MRDKPVSLRRYLLAGILLPVVLVILVSALSLYRQTLQAVNTAYDRTLLASAKAIGELLELAEGPPPRVRAEPAQPEFLGLRADAASGAVYLHDQPLDLTVREAALLHALLARPGHAVPKERLFELVFPGETEVQYEAIEVVVYRLRKKLAHTGTVLMTLRGLGYLLKKA